MGKRFQKDWSGRILGVRVGPSGSWINEDLIELSVKELVIQSSLISLG